MSKAIRNAASFGSVGTNVARIQPRREGMVLDHELLAEQVLELAERRAHPQAGLRAQQGSVDLDAFDGAVVDPQRYAGRAVRGRDHVTVGATGGYSVPGGACPVGRLLRGHAEVNRADTHRGDLRPLVERRLRDGEGARGRGGLRRRVCAGAGTAVPAGARVPAGLFGRGAPVVTPVAVAVPTLARRGAVSRGVARRASLVAAAAPGVGRVPGAHTALPAAGVARRPTARLAGRAVATGCDCCPVRCGGVAARCPGRCAGAAGSHKGGVVGFPADSAGAEENDHCYEQPRCRGTLE